MRNFKLLHAKKQQIMLLVLGAIFVMPQAYANPAGYYVGNYQAVGYDKAAKLPYAASVDLANSEAHFLSVRYRLQGVEYQGYIDKADKDENYHFILRSKPVKNSANTYSSYCNYFHNAGSMSPEINCHGSLMGADGYFSLVMSFGLY